MNTLNTLYIECNTGCAGDMLTAALMGLFESDLERKEFADKMNSIGIPGLDFSWEHKVTCGINGIHVHVKINGQEETVSDVHEHHHDEHSHKHHHDEHSHEHYHEHRSLDSISHIISSLKIDEDVKQNAMNVYNVIAAAEAHAHNVPVEQVHFHEVGSLDAVTDVVAVCLLIKQFADNCIQIIASPVATGSGFVKCAHGILPVPAPATEFILRGIPTYSSQIKGELTTPTGAALLKTFAKEFCPVPQMKVYRTGYGTGTKEFFINNFPVANCVRVFYGESAENKDSITEFSCNIDDMTSEELSFAQSQLFENGALDVFTTPVFMKKNRSAFLLTVMCKDCNREKIIQCIFKNTTTIGIREKICSRYVLSRTEEFLETDYGTVRRKTSFGYGTKRSKLEYEDLAKIAKETGKSIIEIRRELE